jgi:Tfp pilus assembly protein PilN
MTVLLVFFSLVALIVIARSTSGANAKAAVLQREVNDLNQQEQAILKQAQQVQENLTPEQKQSLKFAHELVDRKRFSWSRLFADLEGVLPSGVRVGRIAVRQVQAQRGSTIADLELTVTAKSPNAVTDMIAQMDREGIFHAELRMQNLQKGKGEGGSEYELNVQYTPPQSFASSPDQGARAAVERPVTELPGGAR